jgi:hypothetical protein
MPTTETPTTEAPATTTSTTEVAPAPTDDQSTEQTPA